MSAPLPWHGDQWARVGAMHEAGRVPHALLLRGPQGVGKDRFARALTAALLCDAGSWSARPCGECRGCRLVEAGSHPDLIDVGLQEDRASIGIAQIRDLIDGVSLTARYAGRKVVVISPAERMTREAANTLLKTLEEPPGDTVFMLVAAQGTLLPPTVRSRCQAIRFATPEPAIALDWLAGEIGADPDQAARLLRIARGAPLAALALGRSDGLATRDRVLADLVTLARPDADPVAVAEGWRAVGSRTVATWAGSIIEDLIRLRQGIAGERLAHADAASTLQDLASTLDSETLFEMLERCLDARWIEAARMNVNEQLQLEGLARHWRRCLAR